MANALRRERWYVSEYAIIRKWKIALLNTEDKTSLS